MGYTNSAASPSCGSRGVISRASPACRAYGFRVESILPARSEAHRP